MDIEFVELNDPVTIRQCIVDAHGTWGRGLTVDQYVERELLFAKQKLNSDGKLKYVAIVRKDRSDGSTKVVSSMQIVQVPGIFKEKGKDIVDTKCFVPLAVITPPDERGKGYASKLLKDGIAYIDSLNPEGEYGSDQSFSVLYSDVEDYYAKFGYKRTSSHQINISVDSNESLIDWPGAVRPLSSLEDIDGLVMQDLAQLRKIIERDTESDGTSRGIALPTAEVHKAGLTRGAFVGKYLNNCGTSNPKMTFGAECNGSFMLWRHDWARERTDCQRLYVPVEKSREEALEDCRKLLQATVHHAQECKFKVVLIFIQDVPEQLSIDDLKSVIEKLPGRGVARVQIEDRPLGKPMARFSEKYPDAVWCLEGRFTGF